MDESYRVWVVKDGNGAYLADPPSGTLGTDRQKEATRFSSEESAWRELFRLLPLGVGTWHPRPLRVRVKPTFVCEATMVVSKDGAPEVRNFSPAPVNNGYEPGRRYLVTIDLIRRVPTVEEVEAELGPVAKLAETGCPR